MSGFEKVMAGSLRTCKEKFYGAVHDGLKTWVAAAIVDGWSVEDVRRPIVNSGSTTASPVKLQNPFKHASPAKNGKAMVVDDKKGFPKLELNLDLNISSSSSSSSSSTAASASAGATAGTSVEGVGEDDGTRWATGVSPTRPEKNKNKDGIDIDAWVY